jgi:hypothetical protein
MAQKLRPPTLVHHQFSTVSLCSSLPAVTHGHVGPYCFKVQYEFEYCSLYHVVLAREKFWEIIVEFDELPAFRDCFPQRPSGENAPMGAESAFDRHFSPGREQGSDFSNPLGECYAIIKGIERESRLDFSVFAARRVRKMPTVGSNTACAVIFRLSGDRTLSGTDAPTSCAPSNTPKM